MLRAHLASNLWRFIIYVKTSKRMLTLFKYLFVIAVTSIIFLYYILSPWSLIIEDISYGKLADNQDTRIILESGRCSSTTGICYKVYDAADPLSNEINRYLSAKHAGNDHETVVRLIPPKGIAVRHSDTRFWSINHTFVRLEYVAVMLSAPFAVSSIALKNETSVHPNILIIGLGGGSMSSFIQHHLPKAQITIVESDELVVQLAKKWFDVKETDKAKIIVEDGVSYLEKATATGALYDVIMIDACGKNGKFACPSDAFVDDKTISMLARLITTTGVVVVNLLPASNGDEMTDTVIAAFLKEFPSCVKATLKREMNYVLACLRVRQQNPAIGQRLISSKFQEVWQRFRFSQQFGTMEMLAVEANDS